MAIVRWDPVRELAGMEIDRLNRMFTDFYGEAFARGWTPPVDIYETDNHEVVLKAELPDMKREDIHVTFENGVLTLRGERQLESEAKQQQFQRIERHHGAFSRSFTLPNTVDASRISASYKDGVLTVRLPQRAGRPSRPVVLYALAGQQQGERTMAANPWDLMRELATMQDRMNRIWGNYYERGREDVSSRGSWLPPVDIFETEDREIVLKAELPGLRREDINLAVENNTLTIRGERKLDNEIKQENFHRVERAYGSFVRTFSLPPTVDSGRIGAEYKNGVLTVKLPMREEAKPRQIDVQVA
jgi:HSP20 family protein